MSDATVNCQRAATWRGFLDSAATPKKADLVHLADCPACQRALETSAADQATWSLVEETLRDTADAQPSSVGSAVLGHSHLHGNGLRSSSLELDWPESALRDLLPPPRQPDFLARLGRYDVERLIGRGGMGLVFRAHDSQLNRVVAIKILAPHLSRLGAARQRFAREARAVAAVVHPHIVAIHDVVPESDPPFLVMQLVDGPSLQQLVDATGPMPIEQIVRLAIQLAEALAAAHEQGLIHRDIKPGNILLEADGQRALLTDFGLVRTLDDATLTHSGILAGTPHYMSPEQARGEVVDERSDLFALGSVLYHLCTGRPPFRAPQPLAILHRVCHERHRPIREVRRDVPQRLAAIIDRLLSKQPNQRFPSAESLRTELIQLQRGDREPILSRCWNDMRRSSSVKWFAGFATAMAIVIGGLIFFRPNISLQHLTVGQNASAVAKVNAANQEGNSQPIEQPELGPRASLNSSGVFGDLNSLEQRIDSVRNRLEAFETEIEASSHSSESGKADRWEQDSAQLKKAISEFRIASPF